MAIQSAINQLLGSGAVAKNIMAGALKPAELNRNEQKATEAIKRAKEQQLALKAQRERLKVRTQKFELRQAKAKFAEAKEKPLKNMQTSLGKFSELPPNIQKQIQENIKGGNNGK